jgi:hypothetical protein
MAGSLAFGLPFLLAGIFIECAALNIIHGRKHAPDWVIALVGSFFFLAGGIPCDSWIARRGAQSCP